MLRREEHRASLKLMLTEERWRAEERSVALSERMYGSGRDKMLVAKKMKLAHGRDAGCRPRA